LTLNVNDQYELAITVQASPNNLVSVMAADINALEYPFISAEVIGGKLVIYSAQLNQQYDNTVPFITASSTSETLLADLGIEETPYYETSMFWGVASQQPLWQAGQTYPRPSGSVWIKIGSAGNGLEASYSPG
jgi:hypothetical protein